MKFCKHQHLKNQSYPFLQLRVFDFWNDEQDAGAIQFFTDSQIVTGIL